MAEPLTNNLTIQVEGSALPDQVMQLLILAYLEDNRTLPDTFELRFRDPDRIVLEKGGLSIGKKVKLGVRAGDDSSPTWLQQGEITALEVELDGRGSWTVVRGYDATHRLQRGRTVASYEKMSARDIVAKVAGRAGLSVGTVDATPVLAEVIQPNLSDWDFLRRLAGDLGMELTTTEGRVNFRKPAEANSGTPVAVTMGDNLIRFRAAVTAAEQVKDVQVRTWDPKTKKTLVGKKPASSTSMAAIAITPSQVASAFSGGGTLTVTDAPYATEQGHVEALAGALAEQVAGAFAEMEAVVRGEPKLRSGAVIQLSGVGKPFEGRYVVTSARHVFDGEEGYQTWLTVSGGQDRTLMGLVQGRGTAGGAIGGLVPAIVTNTKDPDMLGRVKVKLPWLDDNLETDWARTLQMGGKSGGGLMLPEVDDEVLVGFEQGRIERPFVLGGLYNGIDKPASGDVEAVDASGGSISRRAMASRSGNRIELLDAPNGANGVKLVTGDGKFLIDLDKQGTTIKITSGGKIELKGDGDIKVEAGGNAIIEAKGNLTLKASGNISAEANGNVDVKASANLTLSAQAKAELKSTGQTSVSGTQAELKGTAAAMISGAMVKIN